MTQPRRGTTLRSERAYEGRLLKIDADLVRMPNGTEVELEMIRHPGASAVVPMLSPLDADDPQILLIRQYRYAVDDIIWEIPAGVLDPGETPLECARRELREETGAVADSIDHLTTIYTTPGFTDERIHLFLATGLSTGTAALKPDEMLETRPEPLSRILELIADGQIQDGKTIIAILFTAGFRLNL